MDKPFDETNSSNPFFKNRHLNECIRDEQGNVLTAEYIWSKKGKDREDLLEYVFNYYREKGFPNIKLSENQLWKSYKTICRTDLRTVMENGVIKNCYNHGLDITKHFLGEIFYKCRLYNRVTSVYDIFYHDERFRRVLKSRMGWLKITRNGEKRPHIYSISDKMIIQGIRESGTGALISQFKPVVARFLYHRYCKYGDRVLDFSAGWGARLLAAISLNLEYVGIDPLTAEGLKEMMNFFDGKGKIIKGCSEDENVYKDIRKFNFIMSSPPYFNWERYSKDKTQCYNSYPKYQQWLNDYWRKTVENCYNVLEDDGYFVIAMVEKLRDLEIAKDMIKIIQEFGLKEVENIPFKTNKSHFGGKKDKKIISRYNDGVYVFKKERC